MQTNFPDQPVSARHPVFDALRAKLCREVSGSAMLAALLKKLNGMELASACPESFQTRFDEFVIRAADDLEIVRPFLPTLVQFLPLHQKAVTLSENHENSLASGSALNFDAA